MMIARHKMHALPARSLVSPLGHCSLDFKAGRGSGITSGFQILANMHSVKSAIWSYATISSPSRIWIGTAAWTVYGPTLVETHACYQCQIRSDAESERIA